MKNTKLDLSTFDFFFFLYLMFPNLKETEIGFEQKTISRKEMFNRLIVSPIQRVLDLI